MTVETRRPGRLKGRIRVGPDFDEPLPDKILAAFRGEDKSQKLPPGQPCLPLVARQGFEAQRRS